MGCLLDALTRSYDVLGLGLAAGRVEPASKLDSLWVLEEAGVAVAALQRYKVQRSIDANAGWPRQGR